RDWDVAAVYFQSVVARGGFGGYLESDASPNEWLTGSQPKLLAGYPVDGAAFGYTNVIPGRLHATATNNYAFIQQNDHVYSAAGFLSFPGNSGGPVYVLHTNNVYYPAAVYLGTLALGLTNVSVVRGIDSNAVNLIALAKIFEDSGTNFNGGPIPVTVGGT